MVKLMGGACVCVCVCRGGGGGGGGGEILVERIRSITLWVKNCVVFINRNLKLQCSEK